MRGRSNEDGIIGQIGPVDSGRAPQSGVKILLVSVESKSDQQTVTADRDGLFRANLTTGGWLVYTHDSRGKPGFSRRLEVPSNRTVSMTLVQR